MANAFDELGAHRVEFKADALNLRSQAALEAIGATREGTLRRHVVMANGRVRDTVYFSVTWDEWPAVRDRPRRPRGGRPAREDSPSRAVRTIGPSAVIATVCSTWTPRDRSALRIVQPSLSIRISPVAGEEPRLDRDHEPGAELRPLAGLAPVRDVGRARASSARRRGRRTTC